MNPEELAKRFFQELEINDELNPRSPCADYYLIVVSEELQDKLYEIGKITEKIEHGGFIAFEYKRYEIKPHHYTIHIYTPKWIKETKNVSITPYMSYEMSDSDMQENIVKAAKEKLALMHFHTHTDDSLTSFEDLAVFAQRTKYLEKRYKQLGVSYPLTFHLSNLPALIITCGLVQYLIFYGRIETICNFAVYFEFKDSILLPDGLLREMKKIKRGELYQWYLDYYAEKFEKSYFSKKYELVEDFFDEFKMLVVPFYEIYPHDKVSVVIEVFEVKE